MCLSAIVYAFINKLLLKIQIEINNGIELYRHLGLFDSLLALLRSNFTHYVIEYESMGGPSQ